VVCVPSDRLFAQFFSGVSLRRCFERGWLPRLGPVRQKGLQDVLPTYNAFYVTILVDNRQARDLLLDKHVARRFDARPQPHRDAMPIHNLVRALVQRRAIANGFR